ncbi:MAG: glutamate 5-kinase [Candidatus Omnitrophica bacterium]|nr:glutamate 5-kinase [Candidatus Omnitrophota bacterium]
MMKTLKLKRIVVKVGTKVLAGKDGLDRARLKLLVAQVSAITARGIEVALVSSGAIASGMGLLGFKKKPADLSELQACAAVGQTHLMESYDNLFKAHDKLTAQILLTQDDLDDRSRYLNAKHTFLELLRRGVVPIVNENDTVSTDEIKFGDNDKLASLVASLIDADLLILLSNVDGLYRSDASSKKDEVVSVVEKITSEIESLARKSQDELGTGGMFSKIQAAKVSVKSGIPCVIANGGRENALCDVLDGKSGGTLFLPASSKLAARDCWLCFSARPKGRIKVDAGAKAALVERNKSLLASGIIAVSGEFRKNDVVKILDQAGEEFARGISNYSFSEIEKIKGLKTPEVSKALGYRSADEVVHKDNLAVLR